MTLAWKKVSCDNLKSDFFTNQYYTDYSYKTLQINLLLLYTYTICKQNFSKISYIFKILRAKNQTSVL